MTQKIWQKVNLRNALIKAPIAWFKRSWWHKLITVFVVLIFVWIIFMYSIAQWYIYSQRNQPYNLGVTFVPSYASYLGLDPNQTLNAILTQLKISNIRLTSYWNEIEPEPGVYNFTELDSEFQQAAAAHVPITLTLGLRQPRWPECHIPTWVSGQSYSSWYPELMSFIATVVNRYKNNPDLNSYQLENEYFLKAFGTCTNYSRQRLISETNLVRSLDPKHTLIISRSNNAIGIPLGKPTPDEFGVSIYKRVWDKTITHRYFEYPIPAWYYGFLAGITKIVTGKNMIIHELQAEPWPPTAMLQASQAEQAKSMNPAILKSRFQYAEATGMKTIDFWGVEWWYYEKTLYHNPSDWNVAQQEFNLAAQHNQQLMQDGH